MKRGHRPCTVCTHPHVKKIDDALVLRSMTQQRIADKYGLHYDAIRRHFANHVPEDKRREIVLVRKVDEQKAVASALNDERLDVSRTYESLARRVEQLIAKAEADDKDALALAAMEGLRRVLRDIAQLQGKLAQQLTVQVSLMESPEWLAVRDVLEAVFARHPAAGQMFVEYVQRRKMSIARNDA